jgi:hypothetical protein
MGGHASACVAHPGPAPGALRFSARIKGPEGCAASRPRGPGQEYRESGTRGTFMAQDARNVPPVVFGTRDPSVCVHRPDRRSSNDRAPALVRRHARQRADSDRIVIGGRDRPGWSGAGHRAGAPDRGAPEAAKRVKPERRRRLWPHEHVPDAYLRKAAGGSRVCHVVAPGRSGGSLTQPDRPYGGTDRMPAPVADATRVPGSMNADSPPRGGGELPFNARVG